MRNNYDIVIAAIPGWRPTYWIPKFGISAIQRITGCDLKEAVDIKERMEYECALPRAKW